MSGLFKIKYRGIGIRVVYTLVKEVEIMTIVAISAREDRRLNIRMDSKIIFNCNLENMRKVNIGFLMRKI